MCVFYPLLGLGMIVNGLGVVLPYQIRFAGLQTDVFFNNRNFNVYEYGNEIPRYAPAFRQAKTLAKRLIRLKSSYWHGPYNVRLIDGFDLPFDLGWMVWRGIKPSAIVMFDTSASQPIHTLALQIKNHQMLPNGFQAAFLTFTLNGQPLTLDEVPVASLAANTEHEFKFDLTQLELKPQSNQLVIESVFESSSAAQLQKDQALFLQIIRVNDLAQNIATIDYPYVSPISRELLDLEYHYWGGLEQNPWSIWHMHSGVYEQTFDFWWLRPFHYWDLPKDFFIALALLNSLGLLYTGIKVCSTL